MLHVWVMCINFLAKAEVLCYIAIMSHTIYSDIKQRQTVGDPLSCLLLAVGRVTMEQTKEVNDIHLSKVTNLHRSETVEQLESSLKSLSSWCGLSIHKGWWENMKPAGFWYSLFEMFPAALSCWWPSEWNKGLASVFACGKWHLLFLISDVIHVLDSEPSPSHYFGLF